MLATFFTIWTQNHANANNLLKAQTYLSVSYNHYEKVSTANTVFIGLEILDDGPMFSGKARR